MTLGSPTRRPEPTVRQDHEPTHALSCRREAAPDKGTARIPLRYDRRLPRVLHVLLHLQGMEGPLTSEVIATMLGTNPAFVRRTMAGLRERGWVTSSRGQGGGWRLAAPLSEIRLLDLYEALGSPGLFALAQSEDTPRCLMEQAANAAVEQALAAAEATFRASLAGVTVADLAEDFERRLETVGRSAWVPPSEMDPAEDEDRS